MNQTQLKQHAVQRWAQTVHRETTEQKHSPAVAADADASRGRMLRTQSSLAQQAMQHVPNLPTQEPFAAAVAAPPAAATLAPTAHCVPPLAPHMRGQKRLRSPSPLTLPPQRSSMAASAAHPRPVAAKMRLEPRLGTMQAPVRRESAAISVLLRAAAYLELNDSDWPAAEAARKTTEAR